MQEATSDDFDKDQLLKDFLDEFFDYEGLDAVGFWCGVQKDDYKGQADRICAYFGFGSVYEYGKDSIRCHVSYGVKYRPNNEPFITKIKGIYDD